MRQIYETNFIYINFPISTTPEPPYFEHYIVRLVTVNFIKINKFFEVILILRLLIWTNAHQYLKITLHGFELRIRQKKSKEHETFIFDSLFESQLEPDVEINFEMSWQYVMSWGGRKTVMNQWSIKRKFIWIKYLYSSIITVHLIQFFIINVNLINILTQFNHKFLISHI